MATLFAISGPGRGKSYAVHEPSCLLGRKNDCHICDPFENREDVSRHHARIDRVGDQFLLRDLESRNGTWVNGDKISLAVPLRESDVISICGMPFRFTLAEADDTEDAISLGVSQVNPEDDSSSIECQEDASLASIISEPRLPSSEARVTALLELLGALGRTLELKDVQDSLLTALLGIFPTADAVVIGLRIRDGSPIVPSKVKHRHTDGRPVYLSQSIVHHVVTNKQAILSKEARDDIRFVGSDSIIASPMRSVMCAPLLDNDNRAIGVVQIDTHGATPFRPDDLQVLVAISPLLAMSLRYSQLHKRLLAQQALEGDLKTAHRVQLSLLPHRPPSIPGYEFFSFYSAARQVGGDYYDYIQRADGRLAVVVADASGKGVPAALYISSVSGELKFHLATDDAPASVIQKMNRRLCEDDSEQHFVTMALVLLDPRTHEAAVVNAGHFDPILRRPDGRLESVGSETRGLPLGVSSTAQYAESRINLNVGEMLALFTDGVTDANNSQDQRYGLERILEHLRASEPSVSSTGRRIVQDVHDFMGRQPQFDDMCLICLRRVPETGAAS